MPRRILASTMEKGMPPKKTRIPATTSVVANGMVVFRAASSAHKPTSAKPTRASIPERTVNTLRGHPSSLARVIVSGMEKKPVPKATRINPAISVAMLITNSIKPVMTSALQQISVVFSYSGSASRPTGSSSKNMLTAGRAIKVQRERHRQTKITGQTRGAKVRLYSARLYNATGPTIIPMTITSCTRLLSLYIQRDQRSSNP